MLIKDIKVYEAIDETMKLIHSKYDPNEEEKFGKYAPIYLAPTSNTKESTKVVLTKKKDSALTIGSQGGYIFELLLNGYRNIDCFDVNILQYMYYEYTKAFIEMFPYEFFIKNFTASNNGLVTGRSILLSRFFFDEVCELLSDQAYEYWYTLYSMESVESAVYSRWCRTQYIINREFLSRLVSYYNEKEYNELRNILISGEANIDYHICDLEELHKEFKDKKYDTIILDNILQYYKALPTYENIYNANRAIKNNLVPLLDDNGKMMVCYGFEIPADTVMSMKGIEIQAENPFIEMVKKLTIEQEKKNGFIANMIKKYDDYSVEFIDGVESEKSKNIVLTYQK